VAKTKPDPPADAFGDLLDLLGRPAWDVIIVGDGSGAGWPIGCGWAAALVDRPTGLRKLFHGGMNAGTVTIGELMPYVHALLWYAGKDGPGRKVRYRAGRDLEVLCVSDSQAVVAASLGPECRHAHRELWAILDAFAASGFRTTFRHVRRDVIGLNVLCDELSRESRKAVEGARKTAVETLHRRGRAPAPDAGAYDFTR
jgi:hypothetical protein